MGATKFEVHLQFCFNINKARMRRYNIFGDNRGCVYILISEKNLHYICPNLINNETIVQFFSCRKVQYH